jgi:hypothetical protein
LIRVISNMPPATLVFMRAKLSAKF